MRIEDMKRQLNDKYKQRKNRHSVEIKLKMARMTEKEQEVIIITFCTIMIFCYSC